MRVCRDVNLTQFGNKNKTKNMWTYISFTIFISIFRGINGQLAFGCPTGWVMFTDRCYKFEKDNKLVLEEADAACWVEGATLLAVSDFAEHKFVSEWLMKHDLHDGSTWFTSGTYYNFRVTWGDDLLPDVTGGQLWADGKPPNYELTLKFNRIAYVMGGPRMAGYGWDVVSPSINSAYICEMSRSDAQSRRIEDRDFSYGQGNVNEKYIERGPVMTKQPDNVAVFGAPPSAYIECKSKGNPNPTYTWSRDNGTKVTSKLSNRYTISAGRFTIQDPIEQEDDGLYQCVATNKIGTIISDPAKIVFGYLQSFSPVKPENVQANKFEGSRISCMAPAAYPAAAFSWFYRSIAEPIFSENENMFVSSSGYLYFSEVQPTDGRKYFCSVTLIATSEFVTAIDQPPSRISLGVHLIVSGTEHGYFKPFIYTHTFPSPALRGSDIRIECVAYGSLPLIYSWRREDGRPLEPGTTMTDLNRVLTIRKAELEAEGNYVCTVNGRAGVESKIVTLIVEAKPYFPFGIGDRLADPGQVLKWRCKAVARPAATYSWYKNGQLIENIPGVITVKANLLTIISVDAERDEGMYQCGATNVHGTTFSYGQLKVLSFKPTFDRHPMPGEIQLPHGGNYTIPCQAEGAPLPDVIWIKNGATLPITPGDTNGHLGMTLDNTLVFNIIEFSDQGRYTCKATNINGEATNSTMVKVIRGISIATAPTDSRVKVNRTAFLFCEASYDSMHFDLTYQWKLNDHVINMTMHKHFVQSTKDGLDGLYISSAQFKHTGKYTCEARTTLHVDSRSAYLSVEGPPGPPAGAYVESTSVTANSVRLIWTVSAFMNHGSPINRYHVEAEMSIYPDVWETIATDIPEYIAMNEAIDRGLREDQRSAVIQNLLPDISYSFRVRAINDFGIGHEASSGSVSVKTPATAPVTVVRNVRGLDEGKVGTLNIVWDPLDRSEYSGKGVGYNIYFKKKSDPKEFFHAKVKGANSTMYTHLVGLDNYYLEYTVKVGAFNEHGSGPNTTEHTVMSAEGMPSIQVLMGDCDNYNGTAFSMSWTSVEDTREVMKGRLKGYRVRYWHIDYPEFVTWRDLYGQHDSTIIIGLEDNTNYWASVQVMNYAGVGPIGEIRLAETFHLPPLLYPRHIEVWPHTRHSVRVKWQGISTETWDQETLQGYKILIWKVQEDIRTAREVMTEKDPEAIVDNLQVKTVYVMRVQGYSIGGDGAKSPHTYFTVEGGNVPFDPSTTQFCFNRDTCGAISIQVSIILISLLQLLYFLL